MGSYKIVIDAVGDHGCQREIGDGGTITSPCGLENCPDCKARAFVADLKATGNDVQAATLTHWPNEPGTVVDDLVTGRRSGSF